MISLTIGGGSHGVKCVSSPGCIPVHCATNTCTGASTAENNQFYIVKHGVTSNRKILSGSTVSLRSVNTPSKWLDCSDPTNCIISTCREDNVEDPSNSNYVSSCIWHQFEVFGVGRALNKLLNIEHKLQFRDRDQQTYLSCNGKRCKLLAEGRCQRRPVYTVNKTNGECPIESFSVNKLSEF